MTAENTPKSGAGALAAGGTALALIVVAMGWWLTRDGGDTAEQASRSAPVPQSAQDEGASTSVADQSDGATDTGDIRSPSFDVVRVEPDGSAVIAGQAAPGSQVQLMVDDAVVGTAESDGNGNFVALLDLPPSDAPRVMSLTVDGETMQASDQSVIIGPVAGAADTTGAEATGTQVAAGEQPGTETAAEPEGQGVEAAEGAPDTPPQDPAPQVLLADQDGIRVLQDSTGAQVVSQVRLDTISYDAQGVVTLAGRGAAQSSLRAHLNNDFLADAQVGPDGQWRMTLPDFEPGVYILRIDEIDATGKLLSQVETPFKREDPVQLAAQLTEASGNTVEAKTNTSDDAEQSATEGATVGASGTADTATTAPDAPAASAGGEEAAPPENTTVSEASTQTAPAPSTTTTAGSEAEGTAAIADGAASAASSPTPVADGTAETAGKDLATPTATPADTSAGDAQPQRPALVTVQPGATLWAIARDRLGDGVMYVQVFDANRDKIRNPDLIYPGQVFTVPSRN
ncbi:LysM peptidoglycan-binding domain-containing protein [Aliiroseovarius crassostreae]|uniref:LysM peptidoglycan-binding domain-containing protein n=1 Tax=Aliiroseovarius crassostreae TaxID=154981 RepID=UPI003C7B47B0